MNAHTLYEALEVLRAVKDLPDGEFPKGLEWIRVARAYSDLDIGLRVAGLQVPVDLVREACDD
jgi:hypothetical protein